MRGKEHPIFLIHDSLSLFQVGPSSGKLPPRHTVHRHPLRADAKMSTTTTTRRPWTLSSPSVSDSSVFQPSVRVVTSNMFNRVTVLRGGQQQEVRRSDRHPGADTSVNTRLPDNDRAASRDNHGWLGLGVQLHCFIC